MSPNSSAEDFDGDPIGLPMSTSIWQAVVRELALSPQQTRIVEQILLGRQDKEIAAELNLSVPTIRTYLKRIFDRTGVADRMALVLHIFSLAQKTVATDCRRSR